MKKRSLTIYGHRTSISLEEPFWIALQDIAKTRHQSLARLVQMIDQKRSGGLSSEIRLFVLAEYQQNIAANKTQEDHKQA